MDKAKRSKSPAAIEKAALRELLPDLLARASDNPEAARAALRACVKLRRKPPAFLLTQQNIGGLSPVELSRSLSVVADAKNLVDFAIPLRALRTSGHGVKQPLPGKTVTQISKALISEVAKILDPFPKRRNLRIEKPTKESPLILFTDATVVAFSGALLWVLSETFQPQRKKSKTALPLAIGLVSTFDGIWRHSFQTKTASTVVEFFDLVRRSVPRWVYAELMDDIVISAFTRDAHDALRDEAHSALGEARLKDLQNALRVVSSENERSKILLDLLQECRTRPSRMLPEAIEWIERHADVRTPRSKSLSAADQSQSSDLNYVAVSLLNAWDAAEEGEKGVKALESLKELARVLFGVELFDMPGDVVPYDELKHELTVSDSNSEFVEIVRPGIQWSKGARTSFLVRAVVKPTSSSE